VYVCIRMGWSKKNPRESSTERSGGIGEGLDLSFCFYFYFQNSLKMVEIKVIFVFLFSFLNDVDIWAPSFFPSWASY